MSAKKAVGIEKRCQKRCRSRSGGTCNCEPSYRGVVYDKALGKRRNGPWVRSLAAAKDWRIDAQHRLQRGAWADDRALTIATLGKRWLDDARAGLIRNDAGQVYKPSTLRSYRSSFELHVSPALGSVRLGELRRGRVQKLVDQLSLKLNGSTVRNAIMPLRVICRYAIARDLLAVNPCDNLELPANTARRFAAPGDGCGREAIAAPEEATALMAALPRLNDRAVFATAFYAGLRRSELRGLRITDIDLDAREINVRQAMDASNISVAPKSRHSGRTVPIIDVLADILGQHLASLSGGPFAFPGHGRWGRTYGPFSADALLKRSRKKWVAAGMEPIGLHEARHTYASTMIAANLPIAVVSRRMGHSSIGVTEQVYFHLLPKSHEVERDAMNKYFELAGATS